MKKLFFIFFSFSLFLALPLSAQNYLKAGRAAAEAGLSKSAPKAPNVKTNLNNALRKITQTLRLPKTPAAGHTAATAKVFRQKHTAKPLVSEKLLASKIRAQQQAPSFIAPDEHIFLATSDLDPSIRYSGTVFALDYNGKREIYGVVATHIVPSDEMDLIGVGRQFTAVVYHKGKPVQIPAQIVASSPVSMLDISLVKFPADKEALLKPFTLGQAQDGETLRSLGFAQGRFAYVPNRKVIHNSHFSIRTTMPLARNRRSGLCGSALLNEKNELVGIHTGSTFNPSEDFSFATPANYLHDLVAAYHNKGISKIAFYVDENISIRLNSDEYVTSIMLLDESERPLAEEDVSFRFSHSKVSTMLRQYPQSEYLKLTTKSIQWTPDGRTLLVSRDWLDETPSKTYFYDLKENKLVRVSEE